MQHSYTGCTRVIITRNIRVLFFFLSLCFVNMHVAVSLHTVHFLNLANEAVTVHVQI
jgi:hypothetical protein